MGLTAALCEDSRVCEGSESFHLTRNRAAGDHPGPFDPEGRGREMKKGKVKDGAQRPIGSKSNLSQTQ